VARILLFFTLIIIYLSLNHFCCSRMIAYLWFRSPNATFFSTSLVSSSH
jgi:hypothetical protein